MLGAGEGHRPGEAAGVGARLEVHARLETPGVDVRVVDDVVAVPDALGPHLRHGLEDVRGRTGLAGVGGKVNAGGSGTLGGRGKKYIRHLLVIC